MFKAICLTDSLFRATLVPFRATQTFFRATLIYRTILMSQWNGVCSAVIESFFKDYGKDNYKVR